MSKINKYIIGIDESGRGPLAGPIAVGAVLFRKKSYLKYFSGIRDSKKLSKKQREQWFKLAKIEKIKERIEYKVSCVSNTVIDKKGITYATECAIKRCLKRLGINPWECFVYLDGSLKAPNEYHNQRTIIGGDDKLRCISLAAVIAKVVRDKKMKKYSLIYPQYGFDSHNGYATREHRKKIKHFGTSKIHRISFLKNLTDKNL
ncbi:MAG TPA: ribonuclease HII [Candidatus Paceibacterota bacterium]